MIRLILIATFALHAGPVAAQDSRNAPFDRAAFSSDFAALVRILRDSHPKLQLIRERAAFDSVVAAAESKLPALARAESHLQLMRVVASLEDGHTGLDLATLVLTRYPIETTVFDDGIYITRTGDDAARALGWRLTRIGRVPIDDVVVRLRPYLTADNDMGRRSSLVARLAMHELLRAVGAADSSGAWFIGTADSIWLPRPTAWTTSLTRSARDSTAPLADYLRNRARRFWWTMMSANGKPVVYAQINSLAREPGISFAAYVDSVFVAIDSTRADGLIIDLRHNGGGDGSLSRILVQRLIRTPAINRRNHLYVITGRTTFSAAVLLASALETETAATFVGEPTGAPANHYGEPARIELPATRIRVSFSRLFWQSGDPRDMRPWIPPRIAVPLTFAEWRSNRDPALETILGTRPLPALRVAGAYPTRVTLLADGCGGTNVQSMPTIVEHANGATSIALTHAGNRFEGTVRPDGTFSVSRAAATFSLDIAGEFSADGFRAMVTVNMRDDGRAPCQYTVGWIGTRTHGMNVIPGR